jgi:hypothetical protein
VIEEETAEQKTRAFFLLPVVLNSNAIVFPVVVAQQRLEDLLVLGELLEEPELADLEDINAFVPLFDVEGAGFHDTLVSNGNMGQSCGFKEEKKLYSGDLS